MSEKAVEEYLRDEVRARGGKAYKFVSPGNAGVPDRLVLLPGGRVAFVELKDKGKKPTVLQQVQAKKLQALGFEVVVIDNKQDVDKFIQEATSISCPNCEGLGYVGTLGNHAGDVDCYRCKGTGRIGR